MRMAAGVLVCGVALGVLTSADARAPELQKAVTQAQPGLDPIAISSPVSSAEARALTTAPTDATSSASHETSVHEPSPDLWLLGGVCFGLIAHQLRRKHRQLRPHPFIVQARADA